MEERKGARYPCLGLGQHSRWHREKCKTQKDQEKGVNRKKTRPLKVESGGSRRFHYLKPGRERLPVLPEITTIKNSSSSVAAMGKICLRRQGG